MWRRINENEKQYLLNRYKGGKGTTLLMLILLIFIFKRIIVNAESGIYIFPVVFLVMGVSIIVASIYASKERRDKKLCIEKHESLVCEGSLVSYERIFKRQNRNRYRVEIQVYDEVNNTYITYKAMYLGRSYEIDKLRVGDKMLVIKIRPNREELVCIESSTIEMMQYSSANSSYK
jgi:hypothetical protein